MRDRCTEGIKECARRSGAPRIAQGRRRQGRPFAQPRDRVRQAPPARRQAWMPLPPNSEVGVRKKRPQGRAGHRAGTRDASTRTRDSQEHRSRSGRAKVAGDATVGSTVTASPMTFPLASPSAGPKKNGAHKKEGRPGRAAPRTWSRRAIENTPLRQPLHREDRRLQGPSGGRSGLPGEGNPRNPYQGPCRVWRAAKKRLKAGAWLIAAASAPRRRRRLARISHGVFGRVVQLAGCPARATRRNAEFPVLRCDKPAARMAWPLPVPGLPRFFNHEKTEETA